MDLHEIFSHLCQFDTPTISNALEIARGSREVTGFTRKSYLAASSHLPAVVGFARTATIRSSTPFDPAQRRRNQVAYYDYVASGEQPSLAIIQDIDEQPAEPDGTMLTTLFSESSDEYMKWKQKHVIGHVHTPTTPPQD